MLFVILSYFIFKPKDFFLLSFILYHPCQRPQGTPCPSELFRTGIVLISECKDRDKKNPKPIFTDLGNVLGNLGNVLQCYANSSSMYS